MMRLFYFSQKNLKATTPGHHLPQVKEVGVGVNIFGFHSISLQERQEVRVGVNIFGFHSISLQQRQNTRHQDFRSRKLLNLQDGLVNEHLLHLMKNILKKVFHNIYLEVFE